MKPHMTSATREIIGDFAKEIKRRADSTTAPSRTVIDFRNDRAAGKDGERQIVLVPIELLRYRKDNGRIASDVLSYEKNFGRLDEKSADDQAKIREFLEEKDKDKTKELKLSVEHDGQREPAIITCDGFLINGNRRKMVLEILNRDAGFQKYKTMKEGRPRLQKLNKLKIATNCKVMVRLNITPLTRRSRCSAKLTVG